MRLDDKHQKPLFDVDRPARRSPLLAFQPTVSVLSLVLIGGAKQKGKFDTKSFMT